VLLGLLACVSAGGTGVTDCVLPVTKLQCVRDWRSGFVAGVRFGYPGLDSQTVGGPVDWLDVCSPRIWNQTLFDMSVPSAIDTAQRSAPEWYRGTSNQDYLYPSGLPITQVIVLSAPNPWGSKFGVIPAIIFGYQTNDGLDFAVCGNALYANFYLNPSRNPAPPTPVTLKASFTSSKSEGDVLTSLGSFDALCSTRGAFYLGGDPNTSSKFFIKSVKKPCWTRWNGTIEEWELAKPAPPQRVTDEFECDEEPCLEPCHWDKKHSKKSASFSCAMSGTAIATGKYGAIMFDRDGNRFDWDRDQQGRLQQVKASDSVYEGEPEEAEEQN